MTFKNSCEKIGMFSFKCLLEKNCQGVKVSVNVREHSNDMLAKLKDASYKTNTPRYCQFRKRNKDDTALKNK